MSDISKLLYVISRAVGRVKFETILKYHEWYLCQISRTNHAIICLYYYPQRFVIFTCGYFKLSGNTTALSQSNSRNFSCSSINLGPRLHGSRQIFERANFFTCVTRLYETVQILSQIAVYCLLLKTLRGPAGPV